MKRLLIVVGFPIVLGLLWWGGQERGSATAEVDLDTQRVAAVREMVTARLTELGATKTSEETSYDDGDRSELTFRVPASRLEEALAELSVAGGRVARQRVEVKELSAQSDSLASSLAGVDGCLSRLANRIDEGAGGEGAADELADCREQVSTMDEQLDASPEAAEDAVLAVRIARPSTTNAIVIVAVALLATALAVMAYLTFRGTHSEPVYDVTESRRPLEHELHDHRRWN